MESIQKIEKSHDTDGISLLSLELLNIDLEFSKYIWEMGNSLLNIMDVLHFNWKPDLSTGEESFLFQFANFYTVLDKTSNTLLLIDEGETTFHPQWQKKYIFYIIQFIKDNFPNRKIHTILTSHSPFLLSDIPKQNIIFLDKDEDGNCKVVDGLKEKKQTFGANIHTLLSDSFFMEDGLMGEFAKSKIDDVINYLHGKESKIKSDDEAQKLIHIIGEPIVKNQLQRMLDSRRLSKIDIVNQKIKDMSYELEILKQHQAKIVQDELRDRSKKKYKQRLEDD